MTGHSRSLGEIRKRRICTLLKGIETGDPASVEVVSKDLYIQHNPQTREGGEGLAVLFERLAQSSPRVNIVRVFSDGDFVFAHTEYDFDRRRIGFEIFRFDGDFSVEHWDNIQPRRGPNASGHSMVDGPTQADSQADTEANRARIRDFINEVLIEARPERLSRYIDLQDFTEHNPEREDDLSTLRSSLASPARLRYRYLHRLLADGDFVLAVSEGDLDGEHTSFFDLYRLADGRLVEHWDTIEAVPPRDQWQNDNGKF